MATRIEFDMEDIRQFFVELEQAAHEPLKRCMEQFLEACGSEFLRIVQDEIIRLRVMDSRQLLASFQKGAGDNVWRLEDGGRVLDVGSSVEYAKYVNDGHWTNPRGVAVRFVPGHWEGYRFIYNPGDPAGGMLLRQKWVPGAHYFDSALRILDQMLPTLVASALDSWLAELL